MIVVVVGALLFVSLHSRARASSGESVRVSGTALVGRPVPDVAATALDGHPVSLASYRGKALIVAFGASWCHPCAEEYPLLVKAAAAHPDDLAVVSVMHDDLKGDERAFLHSFGVRWPAIDDASNAISRAFHVGEIPDTFFVTRRGIVQTRMFGITSRAALSGPLDQLLRAS